MVKHKLYKALSLVALMVKNPPANAGDTDSIPGLRRSPGGGHGNPLQYSCLENPMDRGIWQATIHKVSKSQTGLKWLSTHCQTDVDSFMPRCLCAASSPGNTLISHTPLLPPPHPTPHTYYWSFTFWTISFSRSYFSAILTLDWSFSNREHLSRASCLIMIITVLSPSVMSNSLRLYVL